MKRFTRRHRILGSDEFKQVFANNTRSGEREFSVLARSNGLDNGRLGLAIAKKHIRFAVNRNRFKRVARECFRKHQETLKGLDLVVVTRAVQPVPKGSTLRSRLEHHMLALATKCANS